MKETKQIESQIVQITIWSVYTPGSATHTLVVLEVVTDQLKPSPWRGNDPNQSWSQEYQTIKTIQICQCDIYRSPLTSTTKPTLQSRSSDACLEQTISSRHPERLLPNLQSRRANTTRHRERVYKCHITNTDSARDPPEKEVDTSSARKLEQKMGRRTPPRVDRQPLHRLQTREESLLQSSNGQDES